MTKGYKASEFWVTIATIVGTLTATIVNQLPASEAGAITGGLALAYTVVRTVSKIAAAYYEAATKVDPQT